MAEEIKIVVGADTSKLQAELKKAESELKAFQTQLNNTGDSKKIDELNKKIAETKNIISNLKTQLPPIDITADNTQLIAQIKKSEDELKILQGYASQVKITADASQLDATFLKAEAELKAIGSSISLIDIKADSTQIDSTISKVESELMNLKSIPIPITADANQLVTSVAQAENQLESIPPVEIPITANLSSIADIKKFIETNLRDVQGLQANININANTEAFVSELRKAEQELKNIQSELGKVGTGSEFNRLSQNAKKLQTDIAGLKTQITATSGAINKMPQQLNSASYSITNLSRIVSDSAYGFIGIANNIGPFVDSLAAAKKEAAATGQSLGKNLLSSLSGPGGLSLAFAAVTTAITFAQIGFSAWTRSAQKTKDTVDEIKKAQEDFAKSLDSAKASAMSSGIALQSYVDVAKNSTLPIEQRNEALKKANQILGEHGKVLTLTSVATAEGTREVELYTKAIIAQAVATQYTTQIATATIDEIRLKKELTAAQLKLNAAQVESARAGKVASEAARAGAIVGNLTAESNRKYAEALSNVNTIQLKLTSTQNLIASSAEEAKQATIDATAAFSALGTKAKDSTDKAAKGTETLAQALAKFEKSLKATQATGISLGTPQLEINQDKIKEFEGILKKIIEKFNVDPNNKVYLGLEARLQDIQYENLLLKLRAKLESAAKAILLPWDFKPKSQNEIPIPDIAKYIKPVVISIKVKAELEAIKGSIVPPEFVNNIKKELKGSADQIKKAWKDYSTQIDNAATGFLTDAAANIAIKFGEALGAALTGGNFGDVFKGVFELLAGGIQSLGEQLIKIGFLAVIAQQAIAQLLANPFAAIGVGIALVALGAALKNLTTQKRFATGTRYAPGGMALVGERGPEMINLPRGSQVIPAAQTSQMMGGIGGQVEVFGVLRGQDIFFSNKKYGQTYGRTT